MKPEKENIVYYSRLDHAIGFNYIAISDIGLCYVGSQNKDVEETIDWFKKNKPHVKLVKNRNKIVPYANELKEYFNGDREVFHFPIDLSGTVFQKLVWGELQRIPYGKTKTYTDIAEGIGRPRSMRAVGNAIGANPILIAIPCHRVISKSGQLAGYRGGLSMKKMLLELEGV